MIDCADSLLDYHLSWITLSTLWSRESWWARVNSGCPWISISCMTNYFFSHSLLCNWNSLLLFMFEFSLPCHEWSWIGNLRTTDWLNTILEVCRVSVEDADESFKDSLAMLFLHFAPSSFHACSLFRSKSFKTFFLSGCIHSLSVCQHRPSF